MLGQCTQSKRADPDVCVGAERRRGAQDVRRRLALIGGFVLEEPDDATGESRLAQGVDGLDGLGPNLRIGRVQAAPDETAGLRGAQDGQGLQEPRLDGCLAPPDDVDEVGRRRRSFGARQRGSQPAQLRRSPNPSIRPLEEVVANGFVVALECRERRFLRAIGPQPESIEDQRWGVGSATHDRGGGEPHLAGLVVKGGQERVEAVIRGSQRRACAKRGGTDARRRVGEEPADQAGVHLRAEPRDGLQGGCAVGHGRGREHLVDEGLRQLRMA